MLESWVEGAWKGRVRECVCVGECKVGEGRVG